MKNKLLAAVSIAGLALTSVSSANAADLMDAPTKYRTISGVVDLYVGSFMTDSEAYSTDGEEDSLIFGGGALVDIPFNENWSVQLDLGGESKAGSDYLDDLTSSDENLASIVAGGHLNYREMDRFLMGAFGGFGMLYQDESPTDQYVAGLEGQYYMDNITLYGQLGFIGGSNDDEDSLDEGIFVRGVGRFFLSPHQKLQAQIEYVAGEADDDDMDILGWGVEYEHQFANWDQDGGMSGYIKYKGHNADSDGEETTDHRIVVGIKLVLYSGSLLERDRSGASLSLPDFHHWGAIACALSC